MSRDGLADAGFLCCKTGELARVMRERFCSCLVLVLFVKDRTDFGKVLLFCVLSDHCFKICASVTHGKLLPGVD
jgi:hypothetical protein